MKAFDTTPAALQVQLRLWRRMGPAKRVATAVAMSQDARAIAMAGIRARHPDYDELQVKQALFRLTLGDHLFKVAWPHWPLLPA